MEAVTLVRVCWVAWLVVQISLGTAQVDNLAFVTCDQQRHVEMALSSSAPGATWRAAERRCQLAGGHLASVRTAADAACAAVATAACASGACARVHVGLNRFDNASVFRWTASRNALQSSADDVVWSSSMPTSEPVDVCGFWARGQGQGDNGGIGNGPCDATRPYLCQRSSDANRGGFDGALACASKNYTYGALGLTYDESAAFCLRHRGALVHLFTSSTSCLTGLLATLGAEQWPVRTRISCDDQDTTTVLYDDCLVYINPDGEGRSMNLLNSSHIPRPFMCEVYPECAAGTHACHRDAFCSITLGQSNQQVPTCTCTEGFTGNGRSCQAIPTTPPATQSTTATNDVTGAPSGGEATSSASGAPMATTSDDPVESVSSSKVPVFAGAAAGGVFALVTVILVFAVLRRRRRQRKSDEVEEKGRSTDKDKVVYHFVGEKLAAAPHNNPMYGNESTTTTPVPLSNSSYVEEGTAPGSSPVGEPVYERLGTEPTAPAEPHIYNILHKHLSDGRNSEIQGYQSPAELGVGLPETVVYNKLQHTGSERTSSEGNTLYDSVTVSIGNKLG